MNVARTSAKPVRHKMPQAIKSSISQDICEISPIRSLFLQGLSGSSKMVGYPSNAKMGSGVTVAALCGSRRTVPSLQSRSSTMSTGTPWMTGWRTSSSSPEQNTYVFTITVDNQKYWGQGPDRVLLPPVQPDHIRSNHGIPQRTHTLPAEVRGLRRS